MGQFCLKLDFVAASCSVPGSNFSATQDSPTVGRRLTGQPFLPMDNSFIPHRRPKRIEFLVRIYALLLLSNRMISPWRRSVDKDW